MINSTLTTYNSNEKSIWEPGCEDRTEAPVTGSPTISPAPSTNATIPLPVESYDENGTIALNTSSIPTITPAPVSNTTTSPSYSGSFMSTTPNPTEQPTEPFDLDKEW